MRPKQVRREPAIRFDGFFDPTGSPTGGVAAHRVTVTPLWDRERRRRSDYAEFFDDGAGLACTHIFDAYGPANERECTSILNETLVWAIGRCVHLLGQHAVRNCGASGDALVEVKLTGTPAQPMRLVFLHRLTAGAELLADVAGGRELQVAEARRTVVVDAAATIGPDLSVTTRLLATELFHAFGSPEFRQIAPDGALRASGASAKMAGFAHGQSSTGSQ